MPDGTQARLIYVNSPITDTTQKQNIYRRDLVYSCEYGTTVTISAPQITVQETTLSGGEDPTNPLLATVFV
jgi:hypothetical protein